MLISGKWHEISISLKSSINQKQCQIAKQKGTGKTNKVAWPPGHVFQESDKTKAQQVIEKVIFTPQPLQTGLYI